jgi:hypothetical protein
MDNARGGHVDFRILGPLEAIDDAGPVELTGGKQKALLALLLLHADRVCPTLISSRVLVVILLLLAPVGKVT